MDQNSSREQIRIPRLIRAAAEETLRQNAAIQAIVLYGSHARGDQRRGCDYDIAIVSSLPRNDAFEAAKALYHPDLEKKHRTEIASTSAEDLERYANTAGALEARLAREGVLIAGEWTPPDCREGSELDVDSEMALRWVDAAMGNGLRAAMWLKIANREKWEADNEVAAKVQRMAEQVTEGILATFGIYESDIHDYDGTADKLVNAYAHTGWRKAERAEFAARIRALDSEGRAALRAENQKGPFESVDATVGRLGGVFGLLMEWLSDFATFYPQAKDKVARAASTVEWHLRERGGEWADPSISPELMEHVRRTREQAEQLADMLRAR